jgi:hypothetical protein
MALCERLDATAADLFFEDMQRDEPNDPDVIETKRALETFFVGRSREDRREQIRTTLVGFRRFNAAARCAPIFPDLAR